MDNLKQNSKIKGVDYRFHSIRASMVCGEPCEPTELEMFLGFLQDLARAIMAQASIMRIYSGFYTNALNGLEKDLEDTNKEIDAVQKILMQYKGFERN